MESFFTFLERRVDDCSSLLCVGLDPHVAELKSPTAAAALDFCARLVKAAAPYAAAFKPNSAFFEVFGAEGWTALKQVIALVGDESNRIGSRIPVILDAKRGDIASTGQAYARSAFENLGADAITLNPYLGRDAIQPFMDDREKGVFLLCKTSNAGSADLQDLPVLPAGLDKPLPLYSYVASLASRWNEKNNVGLVVGATHPQVMAEIRASAPDLWFLSPGVGAQGGELGSALAAGLRSDGKGMLVNVSRDISRSEDPRKAAHTLRDQISEIKAGLTRN